VSSKPRNSLNFFPLASGAAELILASGSRYRAALLERLGIPFRSEAPNVDESQGTNERPRGLVERLSVAKAQRVADAHPQALIIGSDQVAVCNDQVLGKPGTPDKAREQLALLSGQTVHFLTGLCLLNSANGNIQSTVVEIPVSFRDLTAGQIADYVVREQPLDCAGAFKSEGLGIALFHAIGGSDPNALIGLPLIALCSMLAAEGLSVLGQRLPS
jgi:septum formation protein